MARVMLLSFADSRMRKTLLRLGDEAKVSGFFDEINLLTEQDLDSTYWNLHKDFILSNKRGYGYWIWKSYIVNSHIGKLNDGDFLVYLDAGCELNKYGKKRFNEYLNMAARNPAGFLCFKNDGLLERCWTKGDIFDFFGVRNDTSLTEKEQLLCCAFVINVSPISRNVIQQWADISNEYSQLLTDEPSSSPNLDGFIENRHDQSIFSILLHKSGASVLSGWEIQNHPATNKKLARLRNHPFLAIRNRDGKPRLNKLQRFFFPQVNLFWYYLNITEEWLRLQYHKYVKPWIL